MGLFFGDDPLERRKDARLKLPPPVVDTGWRPPDFWPNLDNAQYISFDTETKDLGLQDHGPGWGRNQGHIVGISIAAQARDGTRGKWYWPIRHEFNDIPNCDVQNVLDYTRYAMHQPCEKIGQNITYDLGYLADEGIKPKGKLNDVMFAEALIDSDALINLDSIANKYGLGGKTSQALYEWIRQAYPHTAETKLRREIYRSPVMLVGPYAEDDAYLPLDIYFKQKPILEKEDLDYIYRVECDLIPMMIAMRQKGVQIDMNFAYKLREELVGDIKILYEQLYYKHGVALNSTATNEVAAALEYLGIDVPRGETGGYSVRKEWLTSLDHPFAVDVLDIREHEKIVSTFIDGYVSKHNVAGRLHPQFHQLKTEKNGTMVGRFASSEPNLQNIPSRSKLGKRVRQMFIPDIGHLGWRKFDFSQIHYRLLAHFAVGPGSNELRDRYINDPKTDYHMDVYRNVAPLLGWNTDYTMVQSNSGKADWNDEIKEKRRPIKNVNFGLLYGQSADSLAYKSGMSGKQADDFFKAYHTGAPYVKPTMAAIGQEAQRNGFVTTLYGRRIRFNMWEPSRREKGVIVTPLSYRAAYARWGSNIRRAYEYRAVNYKFQGSEPDIMKTSMLACWNSGVFDYTGVPEITVHDELDFTVIDDSPQMRKAFDFIQHTMENTTKLRIPIYVDESNGPSWGKAD